MATYNRGNAVYNQPVTLKTTFRIEGIVYDPYEVRTVEIYNANPDESSPVTSYTPTKESTGVYYITIPANILSTITTWYDKVYFTWKSGETETNVLQDFYVSSASVSTMLVELRRRLGDVHPSSTKKKWTDSELGTFIENAFWDFNSTPPGFTAYTPENFEASVPQFRGIFLEGALIFALINIGIIEVGKTFSYSNAGISLNIDRSGKYNSIAQMLMQSYQSKKEDIKKQHWMENTAPSIILSEQLSMRIRTMSPHQTLIR